MKRGVTQEVNCIDIDIPRLEVVTCSVWPSTAGPVERSALLFVFRHDRETFWLEVSQAKCLITLSSDVEHVNAFSRFHIAVCLVSHQKLDQSNASMKASKVKRVESLLRPRWSIDPLCYLLSNITFDPVQCLCIEVLRIGLPLTMALLLLQILGKTLLVEAYQELRTLEGIVISSPVQ